MKKEKLLNKTFTNVKSKLEYIQKNCNEPELFEDLKQLFKHKNFNNVRITHGNTEMGKDLVFSMIDPATEEEKWYAAIVKNKKASQNDFMLGNEIGNQIRLSFDVPFKDTLGNEHNIFQVFIIINGSISENAKVVIDKHFDKEKNYIKIWDYQNLESEFSKHMEEQFLDNLSNPLTEFVNKQIQILSDMSKANSVLNLDINDINDIFINTQISISKEIKKINEYIAFNNDDVKFEQEDIDIRTIVESNNNFIIHGLPTSGKTLFLKNLGIKTLTKVNGKPNAVFYIDLINYNGDEFLLQDNIEKQFTQLTNGEKFEEKDYEKKLILIDSIDFIQNEKIRNRILKSIDEFSNSKKNYKILIATRSLETIKNSGLLKDFKDTEILPFTFSQAHSLVKKIIPDDVNKTNNFIKALKDNLLDSTLQRTPLSLTLMAILYRDDKIDLKELPANVFELYNKFTDIYLDKWDDSKGITQLYQYEQTKNIISFIAYYFHKNRLNSINETELINYLKELRNVYNYDELNDIPNFVEYLKTKKGVFYFDDIHESFMFFNHYFQEFFTSLSVDIDDESILIDKFYDEWWQNSLIFYCGKNPRRFNFHDKIIKEVTPIDVFQKLNYLYNHSKCLQASHSISINNRELIVHKLMGIYNSLMTDLIENTNIDEDFFLKDVPYVNIINQSKVIFDQIFSSKHVSTIEIISFFENILKNDLEKLNSITIYNIAYYLTFKTNNSIYFENISDFLIEKDILWSRIIFVDISFLKLKRNINDKQFLRIKRKMNKNKYIIQHYLKNTISERNDEKEINEKD
ncbi:NACHT domain-containing protein [Empedobacter falsenii]